MRMWKFFLRLTKKSGIIQKLYEFMIKISILYKSGYQHILKRDYNYHNEAGLSLIFSK